MQTINHSTTNQYHRCTPHTDKSRTRKNVAKMSLKSFHLSQCYVTATYVGPIRRIYVSELTVALCCPVLLLLLTPSAVSPSVSPLGMCRLSPRTTGGQMASRSTISGHFPHWFFFFLLQLRLSQKEGGRCAKMHQSIFQCLPIKRQWDLQENETSSCLTNTHTVLHKQLFVCTHKYIGDFNLQLFRL